jgi:hypothetical protein
MSPKQFSICLRAGTLLVAVALTCNRNSTGAELKRYEITPNGMYTFLPGPEGPGIPGGMPNPFRLDFGISGFFTLEYDEVMARLLDLDLTLTGNQPIQENPPGILPVTSERVADWLEARDFEKQPVAGPFDLYTDETFPGLSLIDTLNGMIRLEGGFDATPVDGTGMQFSLNAIAIPEPDALQLACTAGTLAILITWLFQLKRRSYPRSASLGGSLHNPSVPVSDALCQLD